MVDSGKYYPQIDIIKGLAITSVIVLHTFGDALHKIFFLFHVFQAVPIFILVMTVNAVMSFNKVNGESLRYWYTLSYFWKKFKRIIIPFLVLFILSLSYGLFHGQYYMGDLTFIGYLPTTGPGNYFVTLLVEFVLISPLVVFWYRKNRPLTVMSLCAIDLTFQLISPYVRAFDNELHFYLYSASLTRYFSLMALSLFIADDFIEGGSINLKDRKYTYFKYILPVSILYLILGTYFTQPFVFFRPEWGTQNIIAFPYTILLFTFLANRTYRRVPRIIKQFLITIGRASYQVFLIQILFFGLGFSLSKYVPMKSFLSCTLVFIFNFLCCMSVGLIFYYCYKKFLFRAQTATLVHRRRMSR